MKNFCEWLKERSLLVQEMAQMVKIAVEISTPENIEYLSEFPRKKWVSALFKKYTRDIIDYVNQDKINNSKANVKELVDQLQGAGVDIYDMSRETETGDFLKLIRSETVGRWLNKWISLSIIPSLTTSDIDRNTGFPKDEDLKNQVKVQKKNMTADELKPYVGVMWNVNAMEKSKHTYDDTQEENKAKWNLARTLGFNTPLEAERAVEQRISRLIDARVEKGAKIEPDQIEQLNSDVKSHFMNNLKGFEGSSKGNISQWLANSVSQHERKLWSRFTNRPTIPTTGTIDAKNYDYNRRQVSTGFKEPPITYEPHRMEDDPMTLRNRTQTSPGLIPERDRAEVFRDNIKLLTQGSTQKQVADEVGVSYKWLRRLHHQGLKQRDRRSAESLDKLAKHYGLSSSEDLWNPKMQQQKQAKIDFLKSNLKQAMDIMNVAKMREILDKIDQLEKAG